ncbi:META domain-containing protein [Aeromicrobium sp. YIM 150415]|uniref:META domain-containing protein n=1 Tax=Aeromicrobium sp. YIM 150415 TaxID=2803912 RepID=UPI00196352A5|nr:META domain-containing protein [Aeromicrobium sp. YIM 150415]MBM9462206.1 META domain-containing protein [Aeromicrobium sp. YIM 150415]
MSVLTMGRVAIVVVALMVVSACGNSETSDDSADPQATWGVKAERSPYLELADGEVSGSDGCNDLRGIYELEDNQLSFQMQMSTLMACPGVDTWLVKLTSARIEGDTLIIFNRDGDEIGTLERTA